ncbi:metal ABC transporter permease [Aceticella autotrophica]|uniref:Metal ABC transporter permease n=1 Tax=Aceticella autotrophica TaxID=2755338 RepID=A0A975GBP1_9THEO|nr:metal ABC transporter permease [Aceticella autotrophica]QSZ28346.1 metal ABC transporter permease [Aceticella autotrophica]
MFNYEFMRYALIAGFLGGVTCSVIGVLVISMQSSFIGVAVAHAAFAGSIIALFIGINPLMGALIFSILSAATIGPISDRGEFSPDTPLGIIFAMMHGLAFLFMGMMSSSKTQALDLMWGNALAINEFGLKIIIVAFVLVVGLIILFYKEIQAVMFNREIALSVGLPASWIFYGILFLTGITVAANLQSIGGLLVCTLIITPAAAAYQLTYNLKYLFLIASAFGVFSCWAGLILTYYINLPSGAIIVLISSMIFLIVNAFSPRKKVKRVKSLKDVSKL